MNKLLTIFLIITLSFSLVHAEVDGEQFRDYTHYLEENGKLSQELINDLENLSVEQREKILSYITSESTDFWKQWKKLTGKQKTNLFKELPKEQRISFFEKYGNSFDPPINLKSLGDEAILFVDNNIIGNSKGYFQMDKIEEYNQNNPNNKIVSIEYKKEGEISSLIFKKAGGNTLDLTVGKSERGFYFNPDSGFIGRVGTDGKINQKDPFTGKWNGLGNLKIDATGAEVKMSFDFNRNSKGEANDPRNFPKFSNSEDSYSTFRHPSGKGEDGKTKYDLKPGELIFDENGRLKSANNMYKNKGEESWGGFFGEETAITYNDEDFKNTEGSKVMVDLENGKIKAEVKRVQGGFAGDARALIEKQKLAMGELGKKLDSTKGDIGDALTKLKEAQLEVVEAKSEFDNAEGFEVLIAKRDLFAAQQKLDITEKTIKYGIGRSLNLVEKNDLFEKALNTPDELSLIEKGKLTIIPSPDLGLMNSIATKGGLSITKSILTFASTATGAAGDFASWLSKRAENPLFSSLNPAEGTRINLQLSTQATEQLKNVEMYSGSLDITDSAGKLARVVHTATTHGYVLPSTINRGARNFNNVDFTLHNGNYEDGQNIKIFSQNGNLNAIGVGGFQNLKSVKGRYVINAGGGISYRYKIFFFGDEGRKDEYNNVLTADYQTSTDSLQRANEFKKQANDQYSKLYHEYKADGSLSSEQNKELWELWDNNFIEYHTILNSGDIALSVRSSELSQSLGLLSKLDGKSEVSDPIIDKINVQTFLSNKNVQRQLSQRGIGFSKSKIHDFVQAEIKNILIHLKSNPSNTLQFIKDSRNGLYQIRTDYTTYTIDPIAGPFISNILPIIAGSGGSDKNGNFRIDTENSRFGQTIGIFVDGGHYEGIRESLRAKRNANSIRYGIQSTAERIVKQKLTDPSTKSEYQIYSPTY